MSVPVLLRLERWVPWIQHTQGRYSSSVDTFLLRWYNAKHKWRIRQQLWPRIMSCLSYLNLSVLQNSKSLSQKSRIQYELTPRCCLFSQIYTVNYTPFSWLSRTQPEARNLFKSVHRQYPWDAPQYRHLKYRKSNIKPRLIQSATNAILAFQSHCNQIQHTECKWYICMGQIY